MKENKKNQQQENFISQDLIDETQIQIPDGYKIVTKYQLLPPFSYANILYNEEKANYLYFVDEVRLNSQEKQIFESLHHLLEESLETPDQKSIDVTFEQQRNELLKENEKM